MYQRSLLSSAQRLAKVFPIVCITGPRQSGKTTLARQGFSHLPYVNLENLDTRLLATEDTRAFLAAYKNGAIFDEVQHVPQLLSYLQAHVDETEGNGRYILTGSQNFALSAQIGQSLAGRVGMLTLLPLSMEELGFSGSFEEAIFAGGYPRLFTQGMLPSDFYPSYLQTYVERDVRQIRAVEDLGRFQVFLRLCAGRVGQLVNVSSLAVDCGISPTTAKGWLSILEASYIIFPLQPYFSNFSKRLIKSPKLYFYDTGLAAYLLRITSAEQLTSHYAKGLLFENLVILELLKQRLAKGLQPDLYFWRDTSGHEVDCLADWDGKLMAYEIKSSATFNPSLIEGLQYFNALKKPPSTNPVALSLVYAGSSDISFKDVRLLPFKDLRT